MSYDRNVLEELRKLLPPEFLDSIGRVCRLLSTEEEQDTLKGEFDRTLDEIKHLSLVLDHLTRDLDYISWENIGFFALMNFKQINVYKSLFEQAFVRRLEEDDEYSKSLFKVEED